MSQITTKMSKEQLKELAPYFQAIFYGLKPKDVINVSKGLEVMERAGCLNSEFEGYEGHKKALLIGLYGRKLGFSLIEALSNIFIYRNKLTLHTDSGKILVFSSGQCENYTAGFDEEKQAGWCKVKRKGHQDEYIAWFSIEDAKKAGIINNATWKKYPKRMCINRASWFALRDQFADILAGIANYEEQYDIENNSTMKIINDEDQEVADILDKQRSNLLTLKETEGFPVDNIPTEKLEPIKEEDAVKVSDLEMLNSHKFELGVEDDTTT